MVWVKLFKPTWGRIAIFIILFAVIALLDQTFLFFPESPLTYNVIDSAAIPFIIYLIVIPYIVSCVAPAFFIREFRHAKLHEFAEKHKKKPTVEGVVDTMEDYERAQEQYVGYLKKSIQKPEEREEASPKRTRAKAKKGKKTRKARTRRR